MKITKEYIEVENEVYFFKNIKTIDFQTKEYNIKNTFANITFELLFFGIIYIILIAPIFFTINIITIISFLIGVGFLISNFIPKKTKYIISIGYNEIYKSENKEEFLEYKNKILKYKN